MYKYFPNWRSTWASYDIIAVLTRLIESAEIWSGIVSLMIASDVNESSGIISKV